MKIGFGGGCHWCTEAVFSAVKGVEKVVQGWIKSTSPSDTFSEAVIVHYNPKNTSLDILLQIHLETHSSTVNHSMRLKYRSAVYYFDEKDKNLITELLKKFSIRNNKDYITQVLSFVDFKINKEQFLQYFEKNKDAPFCQTYIAPKIKKLKENFPHLLDE